MKKLYIFITAVCCLTLGLGVLQHNFVGFAHAKSVQAEKPEFKNLLAKAEKGDIDAQFEVALGYARGQDTSVDKVKAAKWYEKAAKKGHPVAQNNLAALYMRGKDKNGAGIDKNVKKGLAWYEKAAEQGSTAALDNLALHYISGIDVKKDVEKAVEYYTKSAELGDEMAIFILGKLYYDGVDVPQDNEKATKWFTIAAKKGDKMAENYLKNIKNRKKADPQKSE